MERREFLQHVAAGTAGITLGHGWATAARAAKPHAPKPAAGSETAGGARPRIKLGLVTYNTAKTWDLPTLIRICEETGFEGVELRTTHAHGVEPSLSRTARREVKKRFADSSVVLWGLGTTCQFHSPDPAVVRKNVKTCEDFVKLAADLGARGVKVRPNGLPKEVPVEKTLEQIGKALIECGRIGADHNVEIWVEVHGAGTSHPPNMRKIMDHCGHKQVGVCWNSNRGDIKNGSVREYFDLLAKHIMSVHMRDPAGDDYPYRELFSLLAKIKYDRFTLCEVGKTRTPQEGTAFLKRFREDWLKVQA